MAPTSDAPRSASIIVISKDEPALAGTLDELVAQAASVAPELFNEVEVIVVDASAGRLESVRSARPDVRWIDFTPPEGVRISIPHQRNVGIGAARGDIIVFTDCGCVPTKGWLAALTAPIVAGDEQVTCGRTGATGGLDPYSSSRSPAAGADYLTECPTINLAFTRTVAEDVGGFDESFEYGSDVDFSWRVVHRGRRIRYVPDALVLHDWGTRRRQTKRSFAYGKARARLYHKHVLGHGEQSITKRRLDANDAVPLLYPMYLLGLPIAVRHRLYLSLLLVPLWRQRKDRPVEALVDHLLLGAGVLAGAREILVASRR